MPAWVPHSEGSLTKDGACPVGWQYPTDAPYPSRLILGWSGQRPLHVVAADDLRSDITVVITVYQPAPQLWAPDFRKRHP